MSKQLEQIALMVVGIIVVGTAILLFGLSPSCKVVGGNECKITKFGITLTYPKAWKAVNQEFYFSSTQQSMGLALTSPGKNTAAALTYPYIQSAKQKAEEAGTHATMLLSVDKVSGLYSTLDIRTIGEERLTSGIEYTPADNLISTAQYDQLGLKKDEFVADSNPPFIFRPNVSSSSYALNVNSAYSYTTVASTLDWFKSVYANQAHDILMTAKSSQTAAKK